MNTLVVLLGPTGVGKTEVALQIAEHLQSPIINADSRQLFAEIPIGTAAPTKEQQERVKHYFVGTLHLTDYYSAAKYEEDVLQLLNQLFNQQQMALLSGGSMLYIDAVCQGIDDIPTVDEATRRLMKRKLETEGLDALVAELKVLDPEHYKIVDLHNPRRVVHALEICYMTGNTYSSYRTNTKKIRPFNIIKIGLNRPREEMYERINNRVLKMMKQGLIEEAKAVYPQKGLNALNTVGYKELFAYFDGDISLDDAILKIQSNTRQYMRKQVTWFKRDNQIKWFSPTNIEEIINYIDDQR
ncbi:tRNA dimethylallyltransferase [Hoylesella buccalis ATCC 35310]|uniref:tRNA dimethylallyltransferase n=1 Tax=Hoylesella buccalis ATCC 35310 TaxID=679190 RepID=D1W5C6_9BACT|nr:tRNA (adenosine(37)-N6)-dimethylallyltransferase MiaA [Hoylesella buccalis]EFA92327.1 tRNA dimethylallyltransferase [Hoylesella buccalis ATCC 35310]